MKNKKYNQKVHRQGRKADKNPIHVDFFLDISNCNIMNKYVVTADIIWKKRRRVSLFRIRDGFPLNEKLNFHRKKTKKRMN